MKVVGIQYTPVSVCRCGQFSIMTPISVCRKNVMLTLMSHGGKNNEENHLST